MLIKGSVTSYITPTKIQMQLHPREATITLEMSGMPAEVLDVAHRESSSVRSACTANPCVSSRAAVGQSTYSIGILIANCGKRSMYVLSM